MLIEELILRIENHVKPRYASGIPSLVADIYVLTKDGHIEHLSFAAKTKAESSRRLKLYLDMLRAMVANGTAEGAVQVSSAWITAEDTKGGKEPKRREALIFNGSNQDGNKTIMYQVTRHKGKRKATKLLGSFKLEVASGQDVGNSGDDSEGN